MCDQEYSSADESLDSNEYCSMFEDSEPNPIKTHPEDFEYECLTVQEAKAVLNESIETVSKAFQITPSLAKAILHSCGWKTENVPKYLSGFSGILRQVEMKPVQMPEYPSHQVCTICLISQTTDRLRSLPCEHFFCEDCWMMYFEIQISEGNSANIKCMECEMIATEDFVLALLKQSSMNDKYQQILFLYHVRSHPRLTNCPSPGCGIVIRAKIPSAIEVICNACNATFCFSCGNDYHAPTDCLTLRKWLTKISDYAENAKYFVTHIKSCPECHGSVEICGRGSDNVMCHNCNFEFCWRCMKMWSTHNFELCRMYIFYPHTVEENVQSEAQPAVKKFLYYYMKWQNHSNNLKSAEQNLQKIRSSINDYTMEASGSWIDWNYLLDASAVLIKSRNTLKYTYPCAYYMEPGLSKDLFEYQQAQMEEQSHHLSWQLHTIKIQDKRDLLKQMDTVEKMRTSFLKKYFKA